jgi:hypothetical protein
MLVLAGDVEARIQSDVAKALADDDHDQEDYKHICSNLFDGSLAHVQSYTTLYNITLQEDSPSSEDLQSVKKARTIEADYLQYG